jgi:hypothetical protein
MQLTRILCCPPSQGPGASQVRFCVAALLATLILDEPAMELIRERKEAPVLFEASLQMLTETMERIRSDLAAREQREQEQGAKRIERALKRQQKAFEKVQKEAAAAAAAAGDAAAEGEGGAEGTEGAAAADAAAAGEPGAAASVPAAATEAAEAGEGVTQQEGQAGEAGGSVEAAAADIAAAVEGEQEEEVDEEAEAEREAKADEACDVELNNLRRLCEACAQAMWGSAHYSVMQEPLQVRLRVWVWECCLPVLSGFLLCQGLPGPQPPLPADWCARDDANQGAVYRAILIAQCCSQQSRSRYATSWSALLCVCRSSCITSFSWAAWAWTVSCWARWTWGAWATVCAPRWPRWRTTTTAPP